LVSSGALLIEISSGSGFAQVGVAVITHAGSAHPVPVTVGAIPELNFCWFPGDAAE